MTVVLVQPVGKRPGEIRDYAINWAGEAFKFWMLMGEYATSARVRPTVATGFEYVATVGGQASGKKEPKWPTTLGGTVIDGSITWTAVALSTAGLIKQIQTSTWTAENMSITLSGDTTTVTAGTQAASVKVAGGVDGETWDAVNHVVFDDGTAFDAILRVTIEDEAD